MALSSSPGRKAVLLLLTFVFSGPLNAAFEDPGWGARGPGKGGAFTASARGAEGNLWNPGAVALIEQPEAEFSYMRPFAGYDGVNLDMGYFAFAAPYKKFGFGAAAAAFSGSGMYSENTFILTAAFRADIFSAGVGAKFLQIGYNWDEEFLSLNDPVSVDDGASAWTLDAGIIAELPAGFRAGLTGRNLLPADIGIDTESIVPIEINAALAYTIRDGNNLVLIPEIQGTYRERKHTENITISGGVEAHILDTLTLRAGANSREITVGAGVKAVISDTTVMVDYAAVSFFETSRITGHRVSTTVRF